MLKSFAVAITSASASQFLGLFNFKLHAFFKQTAWL
jgi:hypothetical protein